MFRTRGLVCFKHQHLFSFKLFLLLTLFDLIANVVVHLNCKCVAGENSECDESEEDKGKLA